MYLHGFLSGPGSFKAAGFSDRLRPLGYDFSTPDLNGSDLRKLTCESQLEIIHQQIGLSSGPVFLLGSSLGALLALHAARQNASVKRLVLMAPALRPTGWVNTGAEFLTEWEKKGVARFFHYGYERDVEVGYGLVESLKRHAWPADQPVPRPTLVLHGLRDQTVPWQESLSLLGPDRDARLMLFESDHGLGSCLGELIAHSLAFLSSDANVAQY